MAQIATTIEQSKKLIELGLSADTADMYYYNNDETITTANFASDNLLEALIEVMVELKKIELA